MMQRVAAIPRLLEQVRAHVGADDLVALVEANLDELSEARTVVVARRLCVADRLREQQRNPDDPQHVTHTSGQSRAPP